jgi:Autotransporter beta-domain
VVVAPRDATLFSDAGFVFAEANQDAAQALLARTRPDGGGNTFYNLAPVGGPAARGWMVVTGSVLDPAVGADRPGFRSVSGGVEGGADVNLGSGLRLGAALAYEGARLTDSDGGSADQSLVRVSLYGSQTLGGVGISASLSYAHAGEQLDRATGFEGATSSRGIDDVAGAVQAAAPFQTGGTWITPAVGVLVSDVSAAGFAETDAASAAFALTGQGAHGTAVSPYVTVALSHSFASREGLEVTPDVEVGYRYDALASGLSQTLIAADGTPFFGNRAGLQRSSALVGASLTASRGRWTGFVSYRGSLASNWNNQAISAGFRLKF